jgi:23S rRNA pseudouridine1911/1915/1917 synthase
MIEISKHVVVNQVIDERLVDYCIGLFPQLSSKNAVKKAFKRKELMINNQIGESHIWVKKNDVILLVDNETNLPRPFPLDVEIVYEDEFLVVIDKPSGIIVNGNQFRTVENALIGKTRVSRELDAFKWAKPVHRLDSATSGLLILSKTLSVHQKIAKMFEKRKIKKVYHAIIMGELILEEGLIDASVNKLPAETSYSLIKSVPSLKSGFVSLIKLMPKTGRTHQLRIHCAGMGNPILGDKLYGEKGTVLLNKGLFLAATELNFIHPIFQTEINVKIKCPPKFETQLLKENRRWDKFKN